MKKIYPFKFLDSYTQADSEIFFGREEEIKQLYEMVFQTDILLIYGASGTGKTSLIQCGLASKFQKHDWFALNIRRGNDLNASLEKPLEEAGKKETLQEEENWDWLNEDWDNEEEEEVITAPAAERQLISPLEQSLKNIYLKYFRPIYLIFDQFEELYILGNPREQIKFIETVKAILLIEQPVKLIFSVREEYLGYLYEFEREVPELLRKKLRVETMNLDKVKTVLEGIHENPATLVSLEKNQKETIKEAIFQKIRGEEKTLSIQLPYLQVFLDKLYRQTTQDENLQTEAEFSLEAVQQIGDIGNVLRDFLEEQILRISKKIGETDEDIWKVLSPFATLEGTKAPTTKAMLREQLLPELQRLVDSVVEEFVNARILRYSEKDELYEVAHDSLAKQIAAKRSDEEIAILEIQTLIKNQLAFGNDLFTEKQLNVILPYQSQLNLEEKEKQLLEESIKQVEKQKRLQRRRRNAIIGALALIILILSALSILAYQQSQTAKEEASRADSTANVAEQRALDAENALRVANKAQAQTLLNKGINLLNNQAYDLALEQLQKADSLDPENPTIQTRIKECEQLLKP